jgi:hypothetical protein
MKKQNKVPVTPRGQWDYPGQPTIVPSPSGRITMQGVNYPVMGMDNTGHEMLMMPGGEYQFPGDMVYEQPVMKNGGYTVTRSHDRKGKTHKVTGPDGTVKYFGDSKLGQHPKDPERKAAFYARHKKNLEKNPYFRAFARATWKEGGETDDDKEMLEGVADILRRVEDPANRQELTEYMMGNFRKENVSFDPQDFLESVNVFENGGEMIRRADGSYSRRGLWDNIRANKGSGKKPTKEMLEQERKIRSEEMKDGGAVDLNAFYNQPRFVQTNIFAEGGDFSAAPVNTFMSPGTDNDPRFEQYYNQQIQKFNQSGVKDIPSRNDIYSYYQSSNPTAVADQSGRMMFSNPAGTISAGSTFTQAVDPVTGKVINQGTNLAKSAFDNQARRFDFGGDLLPEFQWAGEFIGLNPWMPNGKDIANESNTTSFTGAAPVSGQPIDLSNTPAAQKAATAWQQTPAQGTAAATAAKAAGNATAKPATSTGDPVYQEYNTGANGSRTFYMQPIAKTQMLGDKAYRSLSGNAMLPIYNPAIGMMSDNGLSGMLKMGLGAISGLSGMATGLDNIVRGFKGRKEPGKPRMDWNDPNNAKALYQEPVQQEMLRKQNNQLTPPPVNPAKPVIPIPNMQQMDEFNRTAAYGGMIKAENGIDFTKNPAIDPSQIKIGANQYGVDVHGGITRTMGANAGVSMFNNALGYQQAMKQVRENNVKAGMTDFAYQPDDTNWMPMGYDTLNTGPGQTQAPNLYTPVQYAGMQMQSQFEEGGEYDLTEEEIRQILAAGGEIEFM